jgi:hypothetical protein
MKKLITLLLAFLAVSMTAQKLEIEPTPVGKFIVVSTFEKSNGETTIRRSAPLDTARTKREIGDFASGISQRIAELDLEKSRLIEEKTRAEEAFSAIEGQSVEDGISEKYAFVFIGKYAFSLRGEDRKMTIRRPKKEGFSRLEVFIEKGEKGSLKIEGQNVALILDTFADAKGKPIDLKFSLAEATLFIAEIDGQLIKFEKYSDDPDAEK